MQPEAFSDTVRNILTEEHDMLLARLRAREDDLRLAAAVALLDREDEKVAALLPCIKELTALGQSTAVEVLPPSPVAPIASIPAPGRGTAYRVHALRVHIPGRIVCSGSDANTFADAIDALGCSAVADLRLNVNWCDLVSKQRQKPPFGRYKHGMQVRRRGEWYIVTHSSTARKAELLNAIATRLGIHIRVETSWISDS